MDNRTNTIAGWVLAACAGALGVSIISGQIFGEHRPEKMGYPIEGVEEAGGPGGAAEVAPIATRLASADVAKGENVFKKCAACHTVNQGGANGIGPNLYGIMGKPHGHLPSFSYSDALKSVPGPWDFQAMDEWLTSPRKYAPGTKMTFAGLSNPQDRADIIAYLNAQGSNLPFPAAPAADAPAPTGDNLEGESQTADLANEATPNPNAPSLDPAAAERAAD